MPKLNSGNERFLKSRSIPYLILKDGTCQIYLGKFKDSEILHPTEEDKEEAEMLIKSMGHYFKKDQYSRDAICSHNVYRTFNCYSNICWNY